MNQRVAVITPVEVLSKKTDSPATIVVAEGTKLAISTLSVISIHPANSDVSPVGLIAIAVINSPTLYVPVKSAEN